MVAGAVVTRKVFLFSANEKVFFLGEGDSDKQLNLLTHYVVSHIFMVSNRARLR